MSDNAIIVFTKNPILGQVKTRLAATVGDDKALEIYCYLLEHTKKILKEIEADIYVFYSEQIINNDLWDELSPSKFIQKGKDLGERMCNAFELIFNKGIKHCILIGTDVFSQTTLNIKNALKSLKKHDVVINPVEDGGYCLLGLNKNIPELFLDKKWSHSEVYYEAVSEIEKQQLSYFVLPTLIDIDTISDLEKSNLKLN